MSVAPEASEGPRRRRRWVPVLVLALIVAAVLASVLLASNGDRGLATTLADAGALPTAPATPGDTVSESDGEAAGATAGRRTGTAGAEDETSRGSDEVAPVVAPTSAAGRAAAAPDIDVSVPPPPEPPAASSPTGGGGSGSAGGSGGSGGSGGGRTLGPSDYATYCASPSTPFGASSAQGLLSAANRERARLGIAPLSWSGSLAGSAAAWSRTMAETGSFAHGAGAGSAENIATASYSAGYSESQAAGVMHAGWMRSSAHCRNVMNPAYSQMGAGLAAASGGTTWYGTQLFR